nr:hypothetical protein [Tanacetum cinerariifolium]
MSPDPSQKLKGVQSLTPKEQLPADTMKALKASKKTNMRQLGTGGSSKGTSVSLGVPDESTVITATSSEGTEDHGDDDEVDWIYTDEDDEKNDDADDDKSIDLEITNDEETEDEFIQGNEQENNDEDQEMTNAKVEEYRNCDEQNTDAARTDDKKTEEVKDDAKKAELPPSSSTYRSKVCVFKHIPPSKIQKPTIDLKPESEKSASEIHKIKKEQAEKQKMPKYTIKFTDKVTLKEYDLKSALYQTMNENKSFNRNPTNHALYHALKEAFIEDENAMDKGVANTVKNHKRQHDDDDDEDDDEYPSARPNHGKNTKKRRTKESESSIKPSTTKETFKGKASSKTSKTSKSATTQDLIKEPIAEVVMDDLETTANEDVVNIENLTQEILVGPIYNLLKGTCTNSIKLEYNMKECFKALTDRLDWNNPEGDRFPFDLTKPLPLKGHPGHLTVAVEYFFNNNILEEKVPSFLLTPLERIKKAMALFRSTISSRYPPATIQEGKVNIGKALDVSLVVTESSETELEKQDTSSRYGNDADADNADIKPIYDKDPMAERSESTFSKPNHMIVSSSSRNSSKNLPRFSSNDMVHNHYLDEDRKKTQERDRNSKTSVMPYARFQSTANDGKPKPRSRNHSTRSFPTSTVYEKTSPRSDLRWKPMGRIFKTVGLRWVPTGKILASCISKDDSEPTHGSNVDILNIYECKQTLDLSAGKSINV